MQFIARPDFGFFTLHASRVVDQFTNESNLRTYYLSDGNSARGNRRCGITNRRLLQELSSQSSIRSFPKRTDDGRGGQPTAVSICPTRRQLSVSFTFSYDFTPRVQDPSLFSQSPIAVSIASRQYRVVDLDSPIYPDKGDPTGSVGIYHNLDRAFVEFSTDFADISVGRDAIAWGSARIVNPTDVVAPFTYNQLDTEDRIGVDAVRVRIPIGAMGEWDTGYIFGEGFDSEKSALFLRSQLNAVETDFSILLVGFQKHLLAGLDIARGIGGAGFWLEAAYVFVESFGQDSDTANNYLRVSTGLDYSFGEKTYGFIEYHFVKRTKPRVVRFDVERFDSDLTPGAKAPENYLANLNQPAYTQGGVYLMGIHYLAPGFSYQLGSKRQRVPSI